jgi:hypothetical protein
MPKKELFAYIDQECMPTFGQKHRREQTISVVKNKFNFGQKISFDFDKK